MDNLIWLPKGLPCAEQIGNSAEYELSKWNEDAHGLRVLFLNLMPEKEKTEWDIARTLAVCGAEVQLLPMKIKGQRYKTTPMAHMESFYLDFEEYESYHFDRLIITGAPLELIPFEEVRYWEQLQRIMHWSDEHADRTLYICWGAQAGLYEHYGIEKYALKQKMFGVFNQKILQPTSPLMKGFADDIVRMPHSRNTEIHQEDVLLHHDELQILAHSDESGVGVVASLDAKRVFVLGHLEYNALTLDSEYQRDLKKNLPIQPPMHYYKSNGEIDFSWESDAIRFYRNWLVNK